MSDFERTPSARALDALVAEAKEHLDVRAPEAHGADSETASRTGEDALAEIDWARLEARIMAGIEGEKPSVLRDVERATAHTKTRGETPVNGGRMTREGLLRVGALVLAAAAAVAFFVRRDREVQVTDVAVPAGDTMASSLRTTEGTGEVRVGGMVATPGYVIRSGDSVEVEGARAIFDRPRKVTWLLEHDAAKTEPVTRLRVKSAGESLVLALEQGVVEAQVVPVPTGEAFAVDIATASGLVRVAVHGTHLRVARAGNRVVVDLTEGVVAIGVPPRTGVTYGTTVTAPAHVELDATDLATLRIDHDLGAVRAPVPLGGHEAASTLAVRPDPSPAQPPSPASSVAPAPAAKGIVPRSGDAPGKGEPSKAAAPPRAAIIAAVRDCAAAHARSGEVQVTVTSDLKLRVSDSGEIESAQFSPPLLPDVQSCAAQVIYKVRLAETGLVTIPIAFSY